MAKQNRTRRAEVLEVTECSNMESASGVWESSVQCLACVFWSNRAKERQWVSSVTILPLAPCGLSALCGQSFGSLSSSERLWHCPAQNTNTHPSALSQSHQKTSKAYALPQLTTLGTAGFHAVVVIQNKRFFFLKLQLETASTIYFQRSQSRTELPGNVSIAKYWSRYPPKGA